MGLKYFLTNSNSEDSAQETLFFLLNAVSRFMLSGIRMFLFLFHVKDCMGMFFQYLIVDVHLLNSNVVFPMSYFKRLFESFRLLY